ncbi:MAG: DUF2442 domain-containing protein [Muribaculaceae bacterium]|nr:DUF2442 domain-containing protein [Muribaculaceae bacterium]
MNKTDIHRIWIDAEAIWIETTDGRLGCEYLASYSRLHNASRADLEDFTLSYYGIHWPGLDEDLSFDGFFAKPGMRV